MKKSDKTYKNCVQKKMASKYARTAKNFSVKKWWGFIFSHLL